jgi:Na+/H+ antiporter NhaC
MIGGMVYVIIANGGMTGIIVMITRVASGRRATLFSTWIMGMVVFFDDYANTLVVGNTMRPLSDSHKISREKLSYVVDSTAAPVAAVAFITTWIGAELSYIQGALDVIAAGNAPTINATPYAIFFQSLPYAFYPFLTLAFVGILIWSGRDYGPMYRAEVIARSNGGTAEEEKEGSRSTPSEDYNTPGITRPNAINAILPVATVVLGAFAGLLFTGLEVVSWKPDMGAAANLSQIIGQADTFRALLWASFSGLLLAILLTISQRILTLRKTIEHMNEGFRTMLGAVLILVLAWSLALVTKNLQTAEFLSETMLQLELAPRWLPLITFLLAAITAFSTGSSWSTMAILYPLLLPTAWNLFHASNIPYETTLTLFHATVASVLTGSVLGDHCSPISDTTILSSLATQCDHMQHVKTQLPYALTTGGIAIFAGIIPVSMGLHPAIAMGIAFAMVWLVIRLAGKKSTLQFHQTHRASPKST